MTFEQFVAEHGAGLLRLAHAMTGDRAMAEDIVQEALMKALRHWDKAGSADRPQAYVQRIVVNEYTNWWRRRRGEISRPIPDSSASDALDAAEALAERDRVWRALSVLSRRQRAVLALRYYEGLSDIEIAGVLGCREGTVRSSAARAFRRLRRHPELAHGASVGPTEAMKEHR